MAIPEHQDGDDTQTPNGATAATGPLAGPVAPQDHQRPPSPPPSVLRQKRSVPGGKSAHTFVNGGKSSRVGEAHQRKYAPHLRLQDPAYQDDARPAPGPKPHGPRQTRPLPKIPRTKSLIGKQPSFTLRHPQPSRPHDALKPPPVRKQEPSFQVRSQSPSHPSSTTLDALQQQRYEEEAQRRAYDQALQAQADDQARQRQAFEQRQQAKRQAYEQARQHEAYEQARQAQADEQARQAAEGQAQQAQADERARQLEAYEQARARSDKHARQLQAHEQTRARAYEQTRQAAERQAPQAHADEQVRQHQAYEQAQTDKRVRQAGEEQAQGSEWRMQLREQQERQLREYEEARQAQTQQLQDCEQTQQPYLGTSDQEDDMEVDAALGVTTTEPSILADAPQHSILAGAPQHSILTDAPSTSLLPTPLPDTDSTQSLLDPALPLPDLFDGQPPVTKPTTAPIWNPPEQVPFRVPSPMFPTPVQAVAPAQDLASAQLVSLLLEHGQQMAQLMRTMITENRELKSFFAHEFGEIKNQLKDTGMGSTNTAAPKDTDDEPEENMDVEDLGEEADDELPAAKRRSRKQKRPSIFDDPQLKPGIKNLQECTKKHLFLLCKAETPTELIERNPPITDEEMQSFLDGEDDLLTCSVQSFRIDFVRPWNENAFNQVAKSVFSKSFLAMYKSGQYHEYEVPSTLLTESIVGRVLDKQMDYRRRMYKQHSKPLSQADIDRIKKRKAMNARRATLREGRAWVVIEFKLNRHKRLFSLLRPIHMSGDETDGPVKTHPPTFRIVEANWQSLAFKTFMRALDALYRERWAHPVGDRATPGNPPRIRVDRPESAQVEDGVAPVGLWKNCYDKKWLESLRPHVRESLQIIDADYDFTLPESRVLQKS